MSRRNYSGPINRSGKIGIRFDPVKECYCCIDFKTGNTGFGVTHMAACKALTSANEAIKEDRLALLKAL